MIKVSSDDSDRSIRLTQTNQPPNVYLDHWAVMSIAEDPNLATRFSSTLKNRQGTLALSWVNLAEFANITDKQQIRAAEHLVDAISPRLFFIAVDPLPVIKSEDEVIKGHRSHSECGDLDLLKAFAIRNLGESRNALSGHGLFSNLNNPDIRYNFDKLGDTFISRIQHLRVQYTKDRNFAKTVQRPPKGSACLPATRFLLPELLRFFVIDPKKHLTRNDAADFLHAIVPLSYCDYVLLDGHWATQATAVARRLYKAGQVTKVAQAFSRRNNGLSKFLNLLESERLAG